MILRRQPKRIRPRTGLSLLEVLLALAILGGALAAVGELMRIGARNAEIARDLSTAQLLGESKMAELEIGFLPLQSIEATRFEDPEYEAEWLYSVVIEQVDGQGLVSIWLRVEQNSEIFSRPVSFELTRWLIDETLLPTDTGV
jgi:type II secretion system protein I